MQLLLAMFRSVIVHFMTPIGVCIDAVPIFVAVLKLARTRRSGVSCVSVYVQPDCVMIPVPVNVVPPHANT